MVLKVFGHTDFKMLKHKSLAKHFFFKNVLLWFKKSLKMDFKGMGHLRVVF